MSEKIKRMLRRNLDSEFKSVKFYIDNLAKLNYKSNKKKIDKLTLDSLTHAKRIATLLLDLNKTKKTKLIKKTKNQALIEERGLGELYKYELKKTDDPKIKAFLRKQIKEEAAHEKIAKSIR